jgi:hypothetical protein
LKAREFGTSGLLGPESAGELAGLVLVDAPVRMSEIVYECDNPHDGERDDRNPNRRGSGSRPGEQS